MIYSFFCFLQKYSSIELYRKIIYQIILNNQLNLAGIEINRQYPSTIFVSYVNKGSEGERLGRWINYIIRI